MAHIHPLERSELAEFKVVFELIEAASVPNATTSAHFDDLAKHFDEDQVIEIVAVISLFGWLNRWNDTMATDLEAEPLAIGADHLAATGWEPGKHAGDDPESRS